MENILKLKSESYLFFRLWMHKISETYCAHMFVHNYRSSSQNVRKQNFSKIDFEVSLAILLDQRKKYSAIIIVHHSIVKYSKKISQGLGL